MEFNGYCCGQTLMLTFDCFYKAFSALRHYSLLSAVVVIGLPLASSSSFASYCDIDQSEFGHAIVQIEQGGNYSTGVVIGKNRLLTVAHAIDWQSQPITITANIRGRYANAHPILVYEDTDLALLQVDTGSVRPIPLSRRSLQVDEKIWVSGYPLGRARTIEPGAVSSVESQSIITSATVFPGVSGGGLVRCDRTSGDYELAGIVTSYLASVQGGEYLNTGDSVSLNISYIRQLMLADVQRSGVAADGFSSEIAGVTVHSSSH